MKKTRFAWSPDLDEAIKTERLWKRVVELGWDLTNSTISDLSEEIGIASDTEDSQIHRVK